MKQIKRVNGEYVAQQDIQSGDIDEIRYEIEDFFDNRGFAEDYGYGRESR